MKTLLDWALYYRSQNLPIFPVSWDTEHKKRKKPLVEWKQYQTVLPTETQIKEWWAKWPDAGIGMATGKLSGIIAVDAEAEADLRLFGLDELETPTTKTGGGGRHFLFAYEPIGNAVRFAPFYDFRGDGGYILLPPSPHESGNFYEWLIPVGATSPKSLLEEIRQKFSSKQEPSKNWKDAIVGIGEGMRNDSAARITGRLLSSLPRELWEIAGWTGLRAWNEKCVPPMEEKELRIVFESISKREEPKRKNRITAILKKPEKGWIADYIRYASSITDAPWEFHLAVAYGILGAASGGVKLLYGPSYLRPNLWTLVLAPTSRYRKSFSLRIGEQILKMALGGDRIYPNEFSPEAMLDIVKARPSGVFVWSEFAGVLARFEREYMSGSKDILADLFDCPPVYTRQTRKEKIEILNPYISVLAASSISWLEDRLRETDFLGGFLTRFLFILGEERGEWKPLPTPADEGVRSYLAHTLKVIAGAETTMVLSAEAFGIFAAWAKANDEELDSEERGGNGIVSSIFRRLDTHVLKLAMLEEIATWAGDSAAAPFVIGEESMTRAIDVAQAVRIRALRAFEERIAIGKEAKVRQKILRIIRENPPRCTKRTILMYSHLVARQVDEILDTLVQAGDISVEEVTGRGGRRWEYRIGGQ